MRTVRFMLILFVATALAAQNVSFESSNLPIVIIDTHGQTIPDAYRIKADMKIIYNGPGQRNFVNDPPNNYNGKIAIELRGSSSQMFPKKQYALETQDADGENLNVELLGLPRENDWILNGPYSDKSLIRNVLIYRLARDLGHYASRTRFCELVLNGDYRGVYILMEKIKRDKHRVAISKLKPDEISGDDLTGGYIVKIDKKAGEEVDGWYSVFPPYPQSPHRIYYQYHYPKPDKIVAEQKTYIQDFIFRFEKTMLGPDFQDAQQGYRPLVDLDSFVDYFILNEISRNVDGYRLSAYLYKDKDSDDPRLHAGPIWDFNLAFGNADYYEAFSPQGWQVYINHNAQFVSWDDPFQVPFWWEKFMTDSIFVKHVVRRWRDLRGNLLSQERLFALIDSYADTLNEAQQRNFERWPVLGKYVWPNYFIGHTYGEEIAYLKNWLAQRLQWMDEQLFDTQAPTAPTNLQASEITSYSVLLSWQAASDNVGIAGYDVYAQGKRLTSTSKLSVNADNLKENFTYRFRVVARDFAGNTSANNPEIVVQTRPFTQNDGIYCPAVASPIVVDGEEDAVWQNIAWHTLEHVIQGSVASPQDFSGRFKIAWDFDNFYLLIRILDDKKVRDSEALYQDDDLEVYFDADNSKNSYYDDDDFRYRFSYQDSLVLEKAHGALSGVRYKVLLQNDGYQAEIAFPWRTLRTEAQSEKVIGFEVQLNDDDNGGERDAKLAWWGSSDVAYGDPSAFGQVKLKGDPTGVKPGREALVRDFFLGPNWPNPFNPVTHIPFVLPRRSHVVLEIFDVRGRRVCRLLNTTLPAGTHTLRVNAGHWGSGLYFYRLTVGSATGKRFSQTKRMLLLK